jgi:hypothetical protein
MIKNADYRIIEIENIKNGGSLTYIFYAMLPLPIVSAVLFSFPLYFLFKIKNTIFFISLLFAIFVADSILYIYSTSENLNDFNGIISIAVSCCLFILFFIRRFPQLWFLSKESTK